MSNRSSGALCALALVLLSAILVAGSHPATAGAARASDGKGCRAYDFIGARGSGQKEKSDEFGMGPEVHDLFLAVRGWVGSTAISHYGVSYPAVGVADGTSLVNGAGAYLHVGFLGAYHDSVREGQEDVEEHIRFRHSVCPQTRFILAGYSQGAQAVGDALQRMPSGLRDLVAAAAFFGDPYFNPTSWSARSDPDPGSYGLLGDRGEWPASMHGKVFSYCHYHDIICNVSEKHLGALVTTNHGIKSAHVTPAYRMLTNGGRGDADKAARDIARALGIAIPQTPYSGPLDLAFAIDSTGSMADEIDEVKINVTSLVTEIAKSNPDFRVGLVDYKDVASEESDYQARVDTPFTNDIRVFDASLNGLEAEGGGDLAESVYSGVMTALGLDWRPGVKKLVIQIGDAPAKDPEPITGYTLRAVQLQALAVDPATVDSIQSGDDPETAASFNALAAATGGTYLHLPEEDLSDLTPSIVNDVRRNAIAPTAVIGLPEHPVAGSALTLSASASTDSGDPIVAYEWDPTGDGTFELVSPDPVAGFVYPAPFSGTVVLRTRSASGLTSTATRPILVGTPPAKRPGKPRRLAASVHGHSVVLSWRSGRGAAPAWFTLYGKRGKVLLHAVPDSIHHRGKGKKTIYELTVRGLGAGRHRFRVSAGNDRGESGKAGPVSARIARLRR